MRRKRWIGTGTGLAALCAATGLRAATPWNADLYLGQGDYWRQRCAVRVTNATDQAVAGAAVDLPIGATPGALAMAGTRAEAVRVCDTNGAELLWAARGADGAPLRTGPLPAGATLTIPVSCPARGSTVCHIYFDNPSAWAVPDFLDATVGLRNGGVESGTNGVPAAWTPDAGDATHRVAWSDTQPHGGARCLHTTVAQGAEATWIGTRQHAIRIEAGARYLLRAWVRAEKVVGFAGWFAHIGNATNSQLRNLTLDGGGGAYPWKELRAEFTAPPASDRATVGTVLRGTGEAWFDDISLECLAPGDLRAWAEPPERLPAIREQDAAAPWPAGAEGAAWRWRFPVQVLNMADTAREGGLVAVDMAPALARLNGRADPARLAVYAGGTRVTSCRLGALLAFPGGVGPRTRRTFHVYLAAGGGAASAAATPAVRAYAANPALPGGETRESVEGVAREAYAQLVAGAANLARNASFEDGGDVPAGWQGAEGGGAGEVAMAAEAPGLLGARAARLSVSGAAASGWHGWHQPVPVAGGGTYLYACWLKSRDVTGGAALLHAHAKTADGVLCRANAFLGVGPGLSGTCDWTLLQGVCTLPADAAQLELHLTMQASGTLWHDGVLLAPVTPGLLLALEARPGPGTVAPAAWAVNAIVKVFRDDLPPLPAEALAVRLTAARGEREPLQVALRAPRAQAGVTVEAEPPRGQWGRRLSAPEVGVVGYVPIDHVTNYYNDKGPAWLRRVPPAGGGGSDGWPGWWPDPILPVATFDLAANATQPVWLTFRVPADAAPGDYRGVVRFRAEGRVLAEAPYTLHVWDFALPAEQHVKAIYDVRPTGRHWEQPGLTEDEARRAMWRFMAERRLCPDTVRPEPRIAYRDGKVEADFSAFDEAATYYFDTLKLPHMYTPWLFYAFGWGHPPGSKFGEAPYEGVAPYPGVDRAVLRPAFVRAYQACLKVFWDHLKARGWDRKCVLYISDEPFDHEAPIRAQMRALCDMIHSVDPAIPIYCSTWHHQPAWDGYLNVWGVGHYGVVPVAKLEELRRGGARVWWTTDGHMCTDTPYCAIERLLPHYCFKYGAEAYEFWGVDWLTYDPYAVGWHAYIHQSMAPGEEFWVRYPNGDGFLAYPGRPFGRREPVPSVRVEQAAEGCEDFEYLYLLRARLAAAPAESRAAAEGRAALAAAAALVAIPNAGGRYSSRILADPGAVLRVKERVGAAIEALPPVPLLTSGATGEEGASSTPSP